MGNVATSLPLFESSKRRVLKTLHVRRFEAGQWVGAPQRFEDGQLGDREAVRARFGGGRYEVIARDGCKIVGRTRFVVDGPSRPLGGEGAAAAVVAGGDGEQRFATATGQRQALVFRLLDEGVDLVDVVERTGIEAAVVRAIFDEWKTPLGERALIEARCRDLAGRRRQDLEKEMGSSWTGRGSSSG
jgi:hypothetical protein